MQAAAMQPIAVSGLPRLCLEKYKAMAREVRVRRVLGIIEMEPSHSVRELAVEVRLSPSHLQRLFKQQIGMRLSELIAELKLQRAATLLAIGDKPIKQIAHEVGYEHQSSFVRAFQRRFACAPRFFRREFAIARS